MAKKGVTSQGRRKIEIKKIQNEDARHVCFSKRKAGIFAKASDISTLCGADVALVVYSPAGNPYSFGSPAVDPVVDRFLSASLIHGGSAHDVGRSHLTQQLNQQYMEVSKQLEASKARKMILQERLAGVVQSQEIEWAKNNIDHLGLEQLERLKDAFERLKGRADARIQDILGTGQRMALHQPQPPPPSMMGFGVPPVGKLLSSSLDLIQERFICSMHGFICVRVREQTWTPHAAVKNDDEKKTGQGTHRIHLLLRRQLRHPKPARISRSKQGSVFLLLNSLCLCALTKDERGIYRLQINSNLEPKTFPSWVPRVRAVPPPGTLPGVVQPPRLAVSPPDIVSKTMPRCYVLIDSEENRPPSKMRRLVSKKGVLEAWEELSHFGGGSTSRESFLYLPSAATTTGSAPPPLIAASYGRNSYPGTAKLPYLKHPPLRPEAGSSRQPSRVRAVEGGEISASNTEDIKAKIIRLGAAVKSPPPTPSSISSWHCSESSLSFSIF
ncbi:unnamed protein product [Musa hybrid cultivar]